MIYHFQAILSDGSEPCGTDFGLVRHDLTTDAGARRAAFRWLYNAPLRIPKQVRGWPVRVRVNVHSHERPYGPALRSFYVEGSAR